ncbi:unnamed protein product [Diatraea saccharalis]|uniref:Regulatory protein zeste n=1 Tax=Diatraea saccharalis TaxID=40085 RepID=A0A9N9N1J8_9NEOP|nr:unnamed protein product [Diatraea saccharalis]
MVEFMEKNGDLSKPSGGPRGRHYIQLKWKELTQKLNSEGTGDFRSEEKWRKVWSDLKNNTKRKWAKINRAASGTGGGPALQLSLTDLENRVMQIIGVQAATGMEIVEAGFQQTEVHTPDIPTENEHEAILEETTEEHWNTPGTSSQPTVHPTATNDIGPPTIDDADEWQPPAPKRNKKDSLAKLFIESDRNARQYARERDLAYEKLEKERIELHDYEIRERVRQRDQELVLQAQWLEFMKECLNVITKYFDKDK